MRLTSEKSILLLIFFFALLLRVTSILNWEGKNSVGISDEEYYDTLALNLSNYYQFSYYKGKPTAGITPLYPIFLSILYSIFGHNYLVVRFTQAILGSLICIITYFIAKLLFNKKIALASLIIIAICPTLIEYSRYLMAETLFVFLFTLSIFYLLKADREKLLKNKMIAGILMGLTSLTKPVVVLFLPLLILWLLIFLKNSYFKEKLKTQLIITSFFFLTLTPWIIRNFVIYHKFVFTTNIGYTFYGANNILSKGGFIDIRKLENLQGNSSQELAESERDKLYFKKGLDFIKEQPLYMLVKLSVRKILYLFSPFNSEGYMIFFGIIFSFSVIGIFLSLKKKESLLLYFIIFYFLLITVIFYGNIRLRVPLLPYLIIFASIGIIDLYRRFTPKFIPISIYVSILIVNLSSYYYSETIEEYLKEVLNFLTK